MCESWPIKKRNPCVRTIQTNTGDWTARWVRVMGSNVECERSACLRVLSAPSGLCSPGGRKKGEWSVNIPKELAIYFAVKPPSSTCLNISHSIVIDRYRKFAFLSSNLSVHKIPNIDQYWIIKKDLFTHKWKLWHHLLFLMSFQTCLTWIFLDDKMRDSEQLHWLLFSAQLQKLKELLKA